MRAALLSALCLLCAPLARAQTPFAVAPPPLSARAHFAAVYASAPDEAGAARALFDFTQRRAPRISLDHVEAFLPGDCAAPDAPASCRAVRSVFCSGPDTPERFVASALMVRTRAGDGAARCYLVSTHHSFEHPYGAIGVRTPGARCRAARTHDLTQSPAGPRRAWAALIAHPRGDRARAQWDERGLSLPRDAAPLPPLSADTYMASAEDDFARLEVSRGAPCEAEAAVDYAGQVEDPAVCDSFDWVGSFMGAPRYARFAGGEAALRLFRFGRADFGAERDVRRRFVDHRFPSWEGVSGFAAICRHGARATPLCIHAKGDAITRFQRQERGRSRRLIIGDDTATGNGCTPMRAIFPN